ncbi:penicillin acylase family protein [Sphingobacteriales bacterium UPWRP_1]|nr:hypothetical protein B6N25_10725 [Sphingobacteriales bacterium TSM_CSS]PSJ73065.1 penicillin acylase family protein [Sphingobacteriales bacterium UPWRP_1]
MVSKILRFTGSLLVTCALVFVLGKQPGQLPVVGAKLQNSPAAMLPPLGKFLNPFGGFWQNAEAPIPVISPKTALEKLQAPVKVVFDDRLVPHIFAQNNHDLYFVQGYITASMRLWQMEFQTHAAAGRISEIVGSRGIEFDKEQRRKGLTYAAEKLVQMLGTDTIADPAVHAYTDGVNAYINSLSYRNLPVEYKLMNYEPEPWTTLKCALLQKKMADDLTGNSADIEYTNLATVMGKEAATLLYPQYLDGQDPIIPPGTKWNFTPVKPSGNNPATAQPAANKTGFAPVFPANGHSLQLPQPETEPTVGSNNWAVNGSKTLSGKPILCNDPHLQLNLPSIWFETQLTAPGINVYGVTIPGGPGIVIGFNDHIAWGVTNAGIDVKDWYTVTYKDSLKNEYKYNNSWKKTEKRIETIKVRSLPDVIDTVIYTHLGPVAVENYGPQKQNLALHWKAHDASNEFKTFYLLNRAKNYTDYEQALSYYECPAQNFAFADTDGDIAIWQQGKFPLRYKEQGKFVLDGSNPADEWQAYIPTAHNPHILNPKRGFVSSANQHPTDPTYPYYYQANDFEYYRNRRINRRLQEMDSITVKDLQQLQFDNYNLQAAESLPVMLRYLKPEELDSSQQAGLQTLQKWDFMNNPDDSAPALYEAFWQNLLTAIWDEINNRPDSLAMVYPENAVTIRLMDKQPDSKYMDIASTPEKETLKDLVKPAFVKAIANIVEWSAKNQQLATWANYKGTSVMHLARIDAFSVKNVQTGGNYGIVNATGKRAGPSWRMVVAYTKNGIEAYGIYPGGQNGNPGSPNYTQFLDKWAKGEYYSLNYYTNPDSLKAGQFLSITEFEPIKK